MHNLTWVSVELQSALGFGKEMATTRTGADIQAVPEHEAKEEERKGKEREIGETMAEEKKDDDVERMLPLVQPLFTPAVRAPHQQMR